MLDLNNNVHELPSHAAAALPWPPFQLWAFFFISYFLYQKEDKQKENQKQKKYTKEKINKEKKSKEKQKDVPELVI